ncbi:hypothetical protein MtrunA17_Chr7g0246161 [Medicago truncatula]|uniref:Transmembrane protein n=1 Tax=Medicago truncatula TaxID=3880 RepID=A0A396H6K8_MEDTR|nr:hypothetical protein MtrunA17_Chr7g0246161 [Medicago truncatula]
MSSSKNLSGVNIFRFFSNDGISSHSLDIDAYNVHSFITLSIMDLISFDLVHNQSMSMVSSTLHIQRHRHSRHLIIVVFLRSCTLTFYSIHMDVVMPQK